MLTCKTATNAGLHSVPAGASGDTVSAGGRSGPRSFCGGRGPVRGRLLRARLPVDHPEVPARSTAKVFSSITVRRRSKSSRGVVFASRRPAARSRNELITSRTTGHATSGSDGRFFPVPVCRRNSRAAALRSKKSAMVGCSSPASGLARRSCAHSRFLYVLGSGQNFLRAIGQGIHFARLVWPGVVAVEGGVDAAQHRLQGNPRLLPGFHQGPVQGGTHHHGPAPLAEAIFDFGEVVEVVLHGN